MIDLLMRWGFYIGIGPAILASFCALIYTFYFWQTCKSKDDDIIPIIFGLGCFGLPLLILGFFTFWCITIPILLLTGIAYFISKFLVKFRNKYEIKVKE